MRNDKVRCSFCGEREDEVAQLIAASPANVFICDNCVDICHETITKERERRKPSGQQ
jgi:ATP-dependent Clp protease ATP-binding subunit ClpX